VVVFVFSIVSSIGKIASHKCLEEGVRVGWMEARNNL
jgi:hypothetical protein